MVFENERELSTSVDMQILQLGLPVFRFIKISIPYNFIFSRPENDCFLVLFVSESN